jgi:hypothetical protein
MYFTQDNLRKANKYFARQLILVAIRKVKTKPTAKYYDTPTKQANIQHLAEGGSQVRGQS